MINEIADKANLALAAYALLNDKEPTMAPWFNPKNTQMLRSANRQILSLTKITQRLLCPR